LLQSAIENVHKEVHDAAQSRRAKQRKRHLGKRSVHAINFGLGEFVLVSKRDFRVGEKLTFHWRGPKRIVGVLSDFLFEVEDLRNGKVSNVHAHRLRFYHDSSLNVTAELIEHVAHNEQGYEVLALKDLRFDPESKQFMVLVAWKGFEEHDSSWEPILVLSEDVPEKLCSILNTCADTSLAAQARETISQC
jgi:hypothetical protein